MPVEASVAMIFWPIRPALPMPLTMTLPRQSIEALDRAAEFLIEPPRNLGDACGFPSA